MTCPFPIMRRVLKVAEILLLYISAEIISQVAFPWNIPAFALTLAGGLAVIVSIEMYINV